MSPDWALNDTEIKELQKEFQEIDSPGWDFINNFAMSLSLNVVLISSTMQNGCQQSIFITGILINHIITCG